MVWLVTPIYTVLLGWGLWVGVRQIIQAKRHPEQLLNPLFRDPVAIQLFIVHLSIAVVQLLVIGPAAIALGSPLWYWAGLVAMFTTSLPIGAFFNRNAQSFGGLIGRWVRLRNFFEYGMHIAVASLPLDWGNYSLLLWWIVGYRLLDVGPRRSLQSLYGTPERLAARPWGPVVNWAVITLIYVLTFIAVKSGWVWYAQVPDPTPVHTPATWEVAAVLLINVVCAIYVWLAVARYVREKLPTPSEATPRPARSR